MSKEFCAFMSENGITHVTTAPYHLLSNGLTKRAVLTVKRAIKATSGSSLQKSLSKFLFTYHITPHTTTGIAPAQLLVNHRLRFRFNRLFPDLQQHVQQKQAKQAAALDSAKPLRSFSVRDHVYTRDFSLVPVTWILGTIIKVSGPPSYHVELGDSRVVHRQVDAEWTRSAHAGFEHLRDSPLLQEDLYFPSSLPTCITCSNSVNTSFGSKLIST